MNAGLNRGLQNPWRRLSSIAISLLFGYFLGSALSTIAGQQAELDIVVAAILVGATELVSWIIYSNQTRFQGLLWATLLNSLKIGMTYSLFVEAFKLGS